VDRVGLLNHLVRIRDRDLLRRLSTIDGANAGHLATAAIGIAIVIPPEVPDLDAYDEGRLAERLLLAAAAQNLGAAVGHFTGPGETWAASAEAKRLLGIPAGMILRETISLGYRRAPGANAQSAWAQASRAGKRLVAGSRLST